LVAPVVFVALGGVVGTIAGAAPEPAVAGRPATPAPLAPVAREVPVIGGFCDGPLAIPSVELEHAPNTTNHIH
jgi:hypothetical protein